MSPEQVLGQEADARSDLFAVGIILYELVAGRHYVAAMRIRVDTMHAIVHDDPPALDAPSAIAGVIRRCLAKQPEQRFQTMAELATAPPKSRGGAAGPSPAPSQPSIACCPSPDMSADKENEYFGDSLAEDYQ